MVADQYSNTHEVFDKVAGKNKLVILFTAKNYAIPWKRLVH